MRMTRDIQPSRGSLPGSGKTMGRPARWGSLGSLGIGDWVIAYRHIGAERPICFSGSGSSAGLLSGLRLLKSCLAAVGIGDAKLPQNTAFRVFHDLGILLADVIIAQKVQEAVYGQMGKVMGKRLALRARFGRNGFIRQDNVADERPLAAARRWKR